jgi:hypothetical protein
LNLKLKDYSNKKMNLKQIDFYTPNVNEGDCLFVPKDWLYSFKNKNDELVWTFTLSWPHINGTQLDFTSQQIETDRQDLDKTINSLFLTNIDRHSFLFDVENKPKTFGLL